MAANFSTILKSISSKAEQLAARCGELEKANAEANAKIAACEAEIKALRSEMERLRTDNDYLSISHRLASSPDEIVKSRRLISGWIREIDRCIARIKE